MEVLRAMVAASTNRMAVAVCDRCGDERGTTWVAGSAIAGPDGWLLAGPPVRRRAGRADRRRRPRRQPRQGARAPQRRAGGPAPGALRDPGPTAGRTQGMRVAITGATGLIGTRIVRALRERGDEVTVLSRNPDKARAALGRRGGGLAARSPSPRPADALAGRDGVVHLAGENVAQRWNEDTRRRDPRLARARDAQPRRRHRRRRPAPARARLGVRRGLLRRRAATSP